MKGGSVFTVLLWLFGNCFGGEREIVKKRIKKNI